MTRPKGSRNVRHYHVGALLHVHYDVERVDAVRTPVKALGALGLARAETRREAWQLIAAGQLRNPTWFYRVESCKQVDCGSGPERASGEDENGHGRPTRHGSAHRSDVRLLRGLWRRLTRPRRRVSDVSGL